MAKEQGFSLGRKALRQVAEVVRRHQREPRNGPAVGYTYGANERPVTGVLIGDMTAATSALTGGTSFSWALLVCDGSGNLMDSGGRYTGINRDMTLSAVDGTLLILLYMDGEWRPIWVGCEADPVLTGWT